MSERTSRVTASPRRLRCANGDLGGGGSRSPPHGTVTRRQRLLAVALGKGSSGTPFRSGLAERGHSRSEERMSHRASLDWLNFLLADLRGGLGPYVNVFLLTEVGWDQAKIGALLTASGLIGIAFHAPIGALIDACDV